MDALRRVYHRAVQIPLDNVEQLWPKLETFETGLNKITAKKFMADLSPAHMQACTVLRQLTIHIGPLYPPNGPHLFLPSLPKFDASERALVGKWKAYLKWEESDPLELDERDKPTAITRIQMVYRKALIKMRYYTEIWYVDDILLLLDILTDFYKVYGVHLDEQRRKTRRGDVNPKSRTGSQSLNVALASSSPSLTPKPSKSRRNIKKSMRSTKNS